MATFLWGCMHPMHVTTTTTVGCCMAAANTNFLGRKLSHHVSTLIKTMLSQTWKIRLRLKVLILTTNYDTRVLYGWHKIPIFRKKIVMWCIHINQDHVQSNMKISFQLKVWNLTTPYDIATIQGIYIYICFFGAMSVGRVWGQPSNQIIEMK